MNTAVPALAKALCIAFLALHFGACAVMPPAVPVEPVTPESPFPAVPVTEGTDRTREAEKATSPAVIPEPTGVPNLLTADAEWSGTTVLYGDVLIPQGRTLRILAGSEIILKPGREEHDEPGFLHPGPEIIVRGRMLVEGLPGTPVTFRYEDETDAGPDYWGGITFDGGSGTLRHSKILQADRGLLLIDASPTLERVIIEAEREGIVATGFSRPVMSNVFVSSGESGLFCGTEAAPVVEHSEFRSFHREGLVAAPGCAPEILDTLFSGAAASSLWGFIDEKPLETEFLPEATVRPLRMDPLPLEEPFRDLFGYPSAVEPASADQSFLGAETIDGDAVWSGRIVIDGRVTVAPDTVLTILPGTTVVFAFRDSDGDGIGESGMHVQGSLRAVGQPGRPIIFTAGSKRGKGLWDAVRIGGEGTRDSTIAFAVVESSHRGIEGVDALLTITDSVFRQNGRGVGAQHSEVEIRRSTFTGNREGIGAFDSILDVALTRISRNGTGLRADDSEIAVNYCVLDRNSLAGVALDRSIGALTGSFLRYNTPAVTSHDSTVEIDGLRVLRNNLHGFLLSYSEVAMKFSMIGNTVGNGLTSEGSSVTIRRSTFLGNLRHTLENDSEDDMDAAVNVWFLDDRRVEDVIFDRNDDPRMGYINIFPMRISLFDYSGGHENN